MKTTNKKIATTPFESRSLKVEVRGGMAVIKQKSGLTALKVLFDADDYLKGDTVYLRAECMKHNYAGEIYEVDGVSFILVPVESIVMLDRR